MKKLLSIFAVVAALFTLSCGGGAATPSETVIDFYKLVADGKYEAAVEHIYFDSADAEQVNQAKAMFVSLLNEKVGPMLTEKGGLKSIEALSETIAEDGKSAKVDVKIVYGNGTEDTEAGDLVLTEAGDWKLKISK